MTTTALDETSSTSGDLPAVAPDAQALARLRDENARLREELAQLRIERERVGGVSPNSDAAWADTLPPSIEYADGRSAVSALSAGRVLKQLAGVSKARLKAGRIRNSSECSELPRPSADEAQLEADFVRWGYCLVADAMSAEQVQAQLDRLVEQAEAERRLGKATMTGRNGTAQLVANMVL